MTKRTTILFREDETLGYRYLGERLPKNARPVGVLLADGTLVSDEGITLTKDEKDRIWVGASLSGGDLPPALLRREAEDFLTFLADIPFSQSPPAGALNPGASLLFARVDLAALHAKHTGRITDAPDVVLTHLADYPVLDLTVWAADNDHLGEALRPFISPGGHPTWLSLLWFYLTEILQKKNVYPLYRSLTRPVDGL